MKRFLSFFLLCACCLVPRPADAGTLEDEVRELKQIVQELKKTVETQQDEIRALKSAPPAPAIVTEPGPSSGPRLSPAQGRWNPDIGVVADVVYRSDTPKADEEGADRVSVRELELIFGSAVDPYSRLDATLAIGDFEEMSVEEAYLTRFALPLDLTARIGRFKPRLGKAIAVHRDSLDTVDEPLVVQRYFGAEGLSKTGVDVTRGIELPWPVLHEATIGVLEGGNGEEGTAFGSTRRRPTVYGHLKNYLDIDDVTSLEIGLSDAIGSRDEDSEFEVNVLGIDGTLIRHFGPSRRLKLQGEVFNLNRTDSFFETAVDDGAGNLLFFADDLDGNVWGGYALADFRIDAQWAAGFRYDNVQLVDRPVDALEHQDEGYTGYLTFYQSEFARWRVQFSHFDLTDGSDDNQVMVQGTFSIGEHKHKLS